MKSGRTNKSFKNSIYALVVQGITVLLNFAIRTVFIKTLSVAYLGLNGLFTNILNVLSFAELGFGTAIVYAMYKPIAQNDTKKISAYMNYFKMVYKIVGLIILVVGFSLIPNLNFFINDTAEIPADAPALVLIYILYLVNSAASYFFNYKRSLVVATQNGFIDSRNQLEFNFLKCAAQFLILIFLKSYLGYLVIQIACTLLGNMAISVKADKMFPYLKENKDAELNKDEKRSLAKNVVAMSFHKLGSVVVSGVDNILISKFAGIVAMGCYSNYTLLTATIKTVFVQIMTPITASVGNFVAEKTKDDSYNFFHKLFFVNAYGAVFCSSCLMVLANPFIELFWGEQYLFTNDIVLLLLFNFYVDRMRQASQIYIDTNGLFWPIKWKSFVEAIVNLVASLSLLLIFNLGIEGIIIGTLISNFATNFWWEPFAVYKYSFNKNLKDYFIRYVKYTIALFISVLISGGIVSLLPNGIVMFLVKCLIAAIVPNLVMFFLFGKSQEYQYLKEILKKVILRAKK